MANFAWLIEAPGPSYLSARKLGSIYEFFWSNNHDQGIRFLNGTQADLVMMAVREMAPQLFAWPGPQYPKPVEHGWGQ